MPVFFFQAGGAVAAIPRCGHPVMAAFPASVSFFLPNSAVVFFSYSSILFTFVPFGNARSAAVAGRRKRDGLFGKN